MSSLMELGAALRGIITQMEEARAAAGLVQERTDEALRQIGVVGAESASELMGNAIGELMASSERCGELLAAYVRVEEHVNGYLAEKHL